MNPSDLWLVMAVSFVSGSMFGFGLTSWLFEIRARKAEERWQFRARRPWIDPTNKRDKNQNN